MIKKAIKNIEISKVVTHALEGIVPDTTSPSVTILNLRNLPDGDSKKEQPNPNHLSYGQIAINYDSNKEKIFFKNSAGNLAIFDTTKNIFEYVDNGDKHLQDQIDIINSDDTIDGSFAHADKVLEDKLIPLINDRIHTVVGIKGIKATTDMGKNVTIEGIIKTGDKVLNIDNSGFTATIFCNYEWDTGTIKLFGKDINNPISEFKIPTGEKLISAEPYIALGNETPTLIADDIYIKYMFGTDGVVHDTVFCHLTPILPYYKGKETDSAIVKITKDDVKNNTIEANVKVSSKTNVGGAKNTILVQTDGLYVPNVYNAGIYNATSRTDDAKIQNVHSSLLNEIPLASTLKDGEIAVNDRANNEKLFIKNSNGNDIAIFDTTKNILTLVDNKINIAVTSLTDPNLASSLQAQINTEIVRAMFSEKVNQDAIAIINGNASLNGSFIHADKVLEDKLLLLINSITGGTGNTVTIIGGSTPSTIVNYDTVNSTITTDVNISATEKNKISIKSDGLYASLNELNAGTF